MNTKNRIKIVQDALAEFTKKTGHKASCKLTQAGCGQYSVDVFFEGCGSSVSLNIREEQGSFIGDNYCGYQFCKKALKIILNKLRKNETEQGGLRKPLRPSSQGIRQSPLH